MNTYTLCVREYEIEREAWSHPTTGSEQTGYWYEMKRNSRKNNNERKRKKTTHTSKMKNLSEKFRTLRFPKGVFYLQVLQFAQRFNHTQIEM